MSTEFQLPDMSCGHCASRVTQALKQADPGCRVDIDLTTRSIRVSNSSEDPKELARRLSEAGYPPA